MLEYRPYIGRGTLCLEVVPADLYAGPTPAWSAGGYAPEPSGRIVQYGKAQSWVMTGQKLIVYSCAEAEAARSPKDCGDVLPPAEIVSDQRLFAEALASYHLRDTGPTSATPFLHRDQHWTMFYQHAGPVPQAVCVAVVPCDPVRILDIAGWQLPCTLQNYRFQVHGNPQTHWKGGHWQARPDLGVLLVQPADLDELTARPRPVPPAPVPPQPFGSTVRRARPIPRTPADDRPLPLKSLFDL